MRLTCAAPSLKPPPISCQPFGVPCPGTVETMFHRMYSIPSWSVHSVLQAMVQVWQPRHLFVSNTAASWRLTFGGSGTLPLLLDLQQLPRQGHGLDPRALLVRPLPPGDRPLRRHAPMKDHRLGSLHGEGPGYDHLPAAFAVGGARCHGAVLMTHCRPQPRGRDAQGALQIRPPVPGVHRLLRGAPRLERGVPAG